MNNITFAVYKGKEYSAGIKEDGVIVLRSQNPEEVTNGFVEKKIGKNVVFIKYVSKEDISQIFDRRTKAIYAGYEFEVVDEKDDMISIVTMVGDYRVWLGLGMECIDKGVYQKWISKNEAEIRIEKQQL